LSSYLIERLSSIQKNRGSLLKIAESINRPKRFTSSIALQDDALKTALGIFGLRVGEKLQSLELVTGKKSALPNVIPIIEDSVIEHDARSIPHYDLIGSDMTGRAVFEGRGQRLEVYTANRRSLEKVLGVDLIYINLTKKNVVMIQYKMLDSFKEDNGKTNDWIYRPDKQFSEEVKRMKKFSTELPSKPFEYRLNSGVFYLKFVKRDGSINDGGIIVSLEHFEIFSKDPTYRGAKGGLKVSYKSLAGRYIRQSTFIDLVSSGYIGSHAETTSGFKVIIDSILNEGKSVVAAIESSSRTHQENTLEFDGSNFLPDYDSLPF